MKGFRIVAPVLVLAIAAAGAFYLVRNSPEPSRGRPAAAPAMAVEGTRLTTEAFQVVLHSYGIVRPRTESQLISQVSGEIVKLSDRFREGAFFEAGETLLQIDDRDYRAAVEVARANLVQAQLSLKEEQARVRQALRDWQRLGQGDAGELVLRKPQLAAAEARIASARATLTTAELDLERTRIKAPYAGRVLTKSVDLGQVVNAGSTLGGIYAVDYVEVRLPLNNRQLEFIDLPEQYRGGEIASRHYPPVTLEAQVGSRRYQWKGRVVRVEGAIDSSSRQLFVVAQVEDPYSLGPQGNPPLKVGQFVQAHIEGRRLEEVFVLPRTAFNQDNSVLIIDAGRLHQRFLEPVWTDAEHVVVAEGLSAGELLNLTPVGALGAGIAVRATIDGQPQVSERQADERPKKRAVDKGDGEARRQPVDAAPQPVKG